MLLPYERSGRCQAYAGTACREWLGEAAVWVSHDQSYVDEKLSLTFATITASKLMSPARAEVLEDTVSLVGVVSPIRLLKVKPSELSQALLSRAQMLCRV